ILGKGCSGSHFQIEYPHCKRAEVQLDPSFGIHFEQNELAHLRNLIDSITRVIQVFRDKLTSERFVDKWKENAFSVSLQSFTFILLFFLVVADVELYQKVKRLHSGKEGSKK